MNQQTKEATDWVQMWISNDSFYYFEARRLAKYGTADELGEYLRGALRGAATQSAAWHTMRGLSEDDLDAVDWQSIADDLTEE